MQENEGYIDHEVRIRIQEQNAIELRTEMREGFKEIRNEVRELITHMDSKLDTQFKWTVGILLTMFSSMLLTKFL
jgi:hypothetical protein